MNTLIKYCARYSNDNLYFWNTFDYDSIKIQEDSLLFSHMYNHIIKRHFMEYTKTFYKDFENMWEKLL